MRQTDRVGGGGRQRERERERERDREREREREREQSNKQRNEMGRRGPGQRRGMSVCLDVVLQFWEGEERETDRQTDRQAGRQRETEIEFTQSYYVKDFSS